MQNHLRQKNNTSQNLTMKHSATLNKTDQAFAASWVSRKCSCTNLNKKTLLSSFGWQNLLVARCRINIFKQWRTPSLHESLYIESLFSRKSTTKKISPLPVLSVASWHHVDFQIRPSEPLNVVGVSLQLLPGNGKLNQQNSNTVSEIHVNIHES